MSLVESVVVHGHYPLGGEDAPVALVPATQRDDGGDEHAGVEAEHRRDREVEVHLGS